MRKILNIAIVSAFVFVLFQSFESSNDSKRKKDGTEPGYTGSPGDGFKNCTACHGGTPANVEGWITSNIPAEGWKPGQTYTITATNTEEGATRFGFSVSPQNVNGDLLGEIIITDTGETKLVGDDKYITYKAAGVEGVDVKSWTFDWKAPASTIDEVVFYGAFNSNFNGHKDGDKTFLSQLKVFREGFVTSLENQRKEMVLSTCPNPVENSLTISLENPSNEQVDVVIVDATGKKVGNINLGTGAVLVGSYSTELLDAGIYIVIVNTKNTKITRKITVSH